MLTAKNLERLMELEDKLRAEYQVQLDAKSAEIEQANKKLEEQQAIIDKQQATVDKQLETISTLSTQATANQRTEQLNRELHSRCENLQEDIAKQKQRIKTLQNDLAEERAEIKTLKQFDAPKMKKNLDASKKKLAEKTTATDLLQKSLNKARSENTELQAKLQEMEASLAELETVEEEQEQEQEAAA